MTNEDHHGKMVENNAQNTNAKENTTRNNIPNIPTIIAPETLRTFQNLPLPSEMRMDVKLSFKFVVKDGQNELYEAKA